MKWLATLLLLWALPAVATDTLPLTDVQRAITAQPVWLNTSRPLTPQDLQGRIVLLDFWTLGCINCMDIIPDLKALEHEFGADLTVIGIHSAKFANEKDTDNIRNAILRYGLVHPVVNDSDFVIWHKFGVQAWPTLVLISPAGTIASTYTGEGNRAAIESDIRTLEAKYKGHIVTTPLPLALESSKQAQTPLRFPGKIIVQDAQHLIVADSGHNRIVVTDLKGTIQQTIGSGAEGLKDGAFEQAQFFKPQGMAYKDGLLYVADLGNHALRLIDFNSHTVTTLAGTGSQGHFLSDTESHNATGIALASPWDATFYPDDSHLAIAMAGAHQIWSYDIAHHTVSLLAGNGEESIGDGVSPHNSLAQPSGLFAQGGILYFTDAESSALRMLSADGTVTTLIGKGLFDFGYKEGTRAQALLQHCSGLTGDGDNLYIADTYNHSIRRYDLKAGVLYNYSGHDARGAEDGPLGSASYNEPTGITRSGDTLYVADTNNHLLRAIDMKSGMVSTLGEHAAITKPAERAASDPNLATFAFSVAARKFIAVNLELKPGWHINEMAPSELTLSGDEDGKTPLKTFPRNMLKTRHLRLPKLAIGKKYHIKGTIYFCEDKAGSLCMIKSYQVALAPTGKAKSITLPVY